MIGYERRADGYWLLPLDQPRGMIDKPGVGPYPTASQAEAVARNWDRRVRMFTLCGIYGQPERS
jgi:hypothetical protein